MPSATAREFQRAARKLGFSKSRQTGSHERWIHWFRRRRLHYPVGVSAEIEDRLAEHFGKNPRAGVVSVYLYGSHAEARSHRESDVDVGVLLDRDVYPTRRERFEQRPRLISDVGSALGRNDVDLVILNDVSPELGARVATRGLLVSCSDPEKNHAFVRDVQLRAADLKPFLDRMRPIKLEALKR